MKPFTKFGRPVGVKLVTAEAKTHVHADRLAPVFKRTIRATLGQARAAVHHDELASALLARDKKQAEHVMWPVMAVLKRIGKLPYAAVLKGSGQQALSKVRVKRAASGERFAAKIMGTVFNAQNPRAVDWATERAAALVTDVTEAQQETVKEIIARIIAEGIPPRDGAALLGDVIGLTTDQANAVANLYGKLVTALPGDRVQAGSKEIRIPNTLSEDFIDNAVESYSERLLDSRADMIARTETIDASVAGTQEGWAQAVDAGLLTGDENQVWIATSGCCDDCESMDGQVVPMGESFITPDGDEVDGPTLHPNCRCDVGLTEDAVTAR